MEEKKSRDAERKISAPQSRRDATARGGYLAEEKNSMKSCESKTITYAIEHGLRKDDFIWRVDDYQPMRIIEIVDKHTVTVREWIWSDWIAYAVRRLKWHFLRHWSAIRDRIDEWRES